LPTEVLTERSFSVEEGAQDQVSVEEGAQDQAPLDDPIAARTVEDGPHSPGSWSVDRDGQASWVRPGCAEPEGLQEPTTDAVGTDPATSTDAGPSTGLPDPDEAAPGREGPRRRGIFGHLVRKLIPRNDGDRDDAERLFNTAVSRISKGHIKSGFEIINKLLKTNPSFIRPWQFCGDWYKRKEEYAEALFHYEEAIRLGTDDPNTYLLAAHSANQTGDIERAYAILRQGTTKLPHDALPGVLWYNLGCYATSLQDNDEAMCYLREAMNRGFNDIKFYMNDRDLIPLRRREDFNILMGLANTDLDGRDAGRGRG
jgi:tetratricopeptide (TPR) repeat protein